MARTVPSALWAQGVPIIGARNTYEGGSTGRRMGTKGASRLGPNALIQGSLDTMRARSRHARRNNAYAASAEETYVANLIGTGIIPRWKLKNKALRQQIHDKFNQWSVECDADGQHDFYGMQTLVGRSQHTAGEAFTRFRARRLSDGLSVPLQLQMLPADQLPTDYTDTTNPARRIIMGIEFNAVGQRAAYHFERDHPGELNNGMRGRVAVPARDIAHVYRQLEVGQLRGVPDLAPVLVRLYELDEYDDAEIVRKKAAAMFAAFVEKPFSGDDPRIGHLIEEWNEDDYEPEMLEGIEPGAVHYLDHGEQVKFAEPADVGSNFSVWIKYQLRAIAAGIGITYEQMTGDLEGVNYSSIRAGLLEFRRRIEMLQYQMIIFQWCRPVVRRWMDYAVTSGALVIPDYFDNPSQYLDIEWHTPKWGWVDPLKDVMSDILEIRAGLSSLTRKRAERGSDSEALEQEIAEERQRAASQNLVFDSDAGQTNKSGSLQDAALSVATQPEQFKA